MSRRACSPSPRWPRSRARRPRRRRRRGGSSPSPGWRRRRWSAAGTASCRWCRPSRAGRSPPGSPSPEPRPLAPPARPPHKPAMARSAPVFTCAECGATHAKWAGRCDACGAWNSLVEETGPTTPASLGPGRRLPLSDLEGEEPAPPRLPSGVGELDRVMGGGLVPASALLVGGDPGIGKSTLLLQAAAAFGRAGASALYVSGEEAASQIRMRASRLGLAKAPVKLAAATDLRDILATLEAERPDLAILDSIQTLWLSSVGSAPGSVAQVRAAAHELVSFAKRRGTSVVLVGHVTKE